MPFEHDVKSPGDLIRSAEWNAIGAEVQRLGGDKVDRAGDTIAGPLAVRGDLAVGMANAGAAVRVLRRQEDASAVDHGALVLGTGNTSAATLRLGYGSGYSWLQGTGQQALAINPRGGNVGVGTAGPASRLSVAGAASVGAGYAGTVAPANGLIVEGRLGVGVAEPAGVLDVGGDVVMGGPAGQRFLLHTRRNGSGDFLQLTVDGANGAWEWGKGITLRRDTGNVGIGTTTPRSPLDTGKGVMSGAANDYMKAQFTLSGGGNPTWIGGRLGWSQRFIAISANRGTALASGHVNINQPSANIPAEFVYDGAARSVTPAGVALTAWEALYAVHTVGAGENAVSFRIVRYTHTFDAPSNWILVAVVNGDNGTVKLGTGQILGGTLHFGNGSLLVPDQGGSIELGGNNATAGTGTPYIDFHFSGLVQDYNARIINDANGHLTVRAGTFNVRDCFGVSLACADFNIGHPSRRGSPGRALVDSTSTLILNYGSDWPQGVRYYGSLGAISTREVKEDIVTLDAREAGEILAGLEPVRFRLIADEEKVPHLGFIAEDVPDAIAAPDRRAIHPNHIVAVLTRVVKEQQRRLDELTHRLDQVPTHA